MEQDLFGWLNSQKDSRNEGLLVAPLIPERQEDISPSQNEDTPSALPGEVQPADDEDDNPVSGGEGLVSLPELQAEPQAVMPERGHSEPPLESQAVMPEHEHSEPPMESQAVILEHELTEPPMESQAVILEHELTEPPMESQAVILEHELTEPPMESQAVILEHELTESQPFISEDEISAPEAPPDTQPYIPGDEPVSQDHEWQERATGFTLSLDEPPPELWTHINDDDTEPDYEPTDSLQGAAYVQIHGRNFTERLHHTLKHRKERAEERAHSEHEADNSHPYVQKSVILCATLLMSLGFAYLALLFIGRETPEGMKSRALSLVQQGKFEEASQIYRRAHRRYPDDPEFLAGLSEASRKAGHVQTAKTAHDEYIRLTSPDKPGGTQPSPAQAPVTAPKPKPETPRKPAPVSLILNEKPLTFNECLSEANHAYNIGMYTRALEYFSRAMKLNSRDLRPYIGLSASYRMKGWYVDSMHILEEARRVLGRSPALDMETYFLREAK